jgi:predicted kinase
MGRKDEFMHLGKVLTITVGLPASGKTTFARKAGFDLIVSLDDCRETLWGDRKLQHGPGGIDALLALQDAIITAAMKDNKSIIVDNTSILKEYRTPLIALAKKHGYRTQIIYFDIPVEACLKRNKQRDDAIPTDIIKDFADKMEAPAPDEADLVIRFSTLNT